MRWHDSAPRRPPLRLLPAVDGRMPSRVIDSATDRDAVEPRYACGRCGEIVLAGAPLHALASDGGPRKATGVRCWSCAGVSFLQVLGTGPRRAPRRPGA